VRTAGAATRAGRPLKGRRPVESDDQDQRNQRQPLLLLAVALAARDDGGEIVTTVIDDGPGIDEIERTVVGSGTEYRSHMDRGSACDS